MPRPSLLTDELRANLERELAKGATLPVVARRAGIGLRTLERWVGDGRVVRGPVRLGVVVDDNGVERPMSWQDTRAAARKPVARAPGLNCVCPGSGPL